MVSGHFRIGLLDFRGFLVGNHVYANFFTALKYSTFQSASIMTTTGFSTANYQNWPQVSQMLLFLLFFVGGCAGSTGGGIKVIRVRALLTLGETPSPVAASQCRHHQQGGR
jgi:Trk-type K+ transport system membrane component